MRTSPEVRAERKVAHLARIALKQSGDPEYYKKFASQPSEIRKANVQGAQRRTIADAKRIIEAGLMSDAGGAIEVFGGTANGQIAASVSVSTSVAGKATKEI